MFQHNHRKFRKYCKDFLIKLSRMSDFASFTANRVDRTYEIDQSGKFVLVNTKRYKAKTYTREMLADRAYNIYSDKGTEE